MVPKKLSLVCDLGPGLCVSGRKGARIPFLFSGYLRFGSWDDRIARTLCLFSHSPEESGWENSLSGGFLPAATCTNPEERSTDCTHNQPLHSWWTVSAAPLNPLMLIKNHLKNIGFFFFFFSLLLSVMLQRLIRQ